VITRFLQLIVAGSVISTAGAPQSAPDEPNAHAAIYFAGGLEQALLEMRKGAQLLQFCATRLRKGCTKEQRQLVAGNRTISLLDELTLFPQRPPENFTADVTTADVLRERIAAVSTALTRAASDYDRLLIARYGAVLRTCPGETDAAYRESLEALTIVDLRDFQGLQGVEYDRARQALTSAEAQAAETLRGMPAGDCDATLTVGQLLMELMNGKLQPWTREERRMADAYRGFVFNPPKHEEPPTRDVAASIAGNFVTVVATELQLTVYPQTAPRIKALADEVERAGSSK
jgi:hypothetical protein